jgi:hypothetical protein
MNNKIKALLGAIALVGSLVSAFPVLSTAAATCSAPAQLEAMVSQGLPHNGQDKTGTANPPLVRGKKTVVKFFLGPAPSSLSTQVNMSGSSLTVFNGNTSLGTVNPTGTLSAITSTYTKTDDAASDPKFIVPGSMLQASTGSWTATFTATLSYTTQPTIGLSCSGTATYTVSAPVARQSRGLRLLLVPMGDGTQPATTQFTTTTRTDQKSNALESVQNGLLSLSRMLPVADGVDELSKSGSPAGIRWHLDAGMVKLNELNIAKNTSGVYCLNDLQFSKIATKLDAYLQAWNTQQTQLDPNTDKTADRVLGVIDSNISWGSEKGICWDGAAQVPSTTVPGMHGWVRAMHDTTDSASTIRDTGPLLGMEVAHTFGLKVPASLGGAGDNTYHSTAATADVTNPGRGYNTFTGAYIASPKTVMELSTPFTNSNTLVEQSDWADFLCALGGPDHLPTCSSTGGVVATAGGTSAPSASRFYADVLSDGQPEHTPGVYGTEVIDSYYTTVKFETPEPAVSDYHVVFYSSTGTVLADKKIPFESRTSQHPDEDQGAELAPVQCPPPYSTEVCGSLAFAFTVPQFASWEIRKGNTPLTDRRFARAKPTVQSVNVTNEPSAAPIDVTNDASADETSPAISADGKWLLYTRTPHNGVLECSEIVARDITANGTLGSKTYYLPDDGDAVPDVTKLGAGNICHPGMPDHAAWRGDGTAGAFVKNDNLYVFEFDPATGFKNVTVVLACAGTTALGACLSSNSPQKLSRISSPSWSPDANWPKAVTGGSGYRLSFDADSILNPSQRDLYYMDPYSPVVQLNGESVHPAALVAAQAGESSWSNASGKGKTLEYTDLGAAGGSPIRFVDVPNSVLPVTGTQISCCGRRGSYGDRFIAIETENESTGAPTGNIALLDYNNVNKTPAPDVKTTGGVDTSPSITATLVSGKPFSQFLVFDRQDSTHEIYLWNLNTGDKRTITVTGTVSTANLPYASAATALLINGVSNPYDVVLKPVSSVPIPGTDLSRVTFKSSLDHSLLGGDANAGDVTAAPRAGATIDDQTLISDLVFGGSIGIAPKAPFVSILYPTGTAVPSQNLNFYGTSFDWLDGVITAPSQNVWTVTSPDGQTYTLFGQTATLPVPTRGYHTPGLWQAELKVSNSLGLWAIDKTTVRVEVTTTAAGNTNFDPDSLTVPIDPSGTPNVTVYITVAGMDLNKIPKANVAITSIDGVEITDGSLAATGWTPNKSTAVATFDKNTLTAKIYSIGGSLPRVVKVTISGTSGVVAGSYGFTATDPGAPCAHLQTQGSTC